MEAGRLAQLSSGLYIFACTVARGEERSYESMSQSGGPREIWEVANRRETHGFGLAKLRNDFINVNLDMEPM